MSVEPFHPDDLITVSEGFLTAFLASAEANLAEMPDVGDDDANLMMLVVVLLGPAPVTFEAAHQAFHGHLDAFDELGEAVAHLWPIVRDKYRERH